ncbi:MAG: AsmA-like C-terminal domain-containing protein [Desulfobacterales bacterium]|nr:AsmA-like C-terminal domain-containing protein [Desulfobacterales bacterium]
MNATVKRIILYLTASIIALVLTAPFYLESLINSGLLKAKLSAELENRTGVFIDPETIEFKIFPLPGLQLLDFDHAFNPQFRLSVERTEVDLALLKLFSGQIAVDKIRITAPRLTYTPLSDAPDMGDFEFKIPEDAVNELFALFPDSQDTLELEVIQARTDFFKTMDAQFLVYRDNRAVIFKARTDGIDITHGQIPAFDQSTGDRIQTLKIQQAFLDLKLDNTNTLSGSLRLTSPKAGMTDLSGNLLAADRMELDFSLSRDRISATLPPVNVSYPGAAIGVDFQYDVQNNRPTLSFTGKNIDIGQAREVCLPILGGYPVVDELFDILRAGTAGDISVSFSADSLAELFLTENLLLKGSATGATVHIPEVPLIAKEASGRATMKNGVLSIDVQKAQVDTATVTSGQLDVDLRKDENLIFEGKFSLDVNMEQLPATLISLLPGTTLAQELARITKISGRADAELGLRMTMDQSIPDVEVKADNLDILGLYNRVPLPISIQGGQFSYKADVVTLQETGVKLSDAANITGLSGSVDFTSDPVLHIGQAAADISLGPLLPWMAANPPVMSLLSPAVNLKGALRVDSITLDGPMFHPEKWTFEIQGSGSDVDVGFTDKTFAVRKVSGGYKVNERRVDVSGLDATVTDLSWLEASVSPDYLNSIRLPLQVIECGIVEKEGKDFVHGKIVTPAGPLLSFDLNGEQISDMSLTLVVLEDPGLTNVMVIPNPDHDKPMISFEGKLNTLTLEKLLVQGSPLYRKLMSFTAGDPISVTTDAFSQVHLNTERLNLDAVLSKQEDEDNGPSRPLLAQKAMFLKADSLIFKSREFKDVDSKISFSPDKTRIRVLHAELCDLIAGGYTDIFHGTDIPRIVTEFKINSQQRKDISKVLGCLFNTESLIEGSYKLDSKLTGSADANLISARQNGSLRFEAKDGRIYKATLLSRVLSVINVFSETDIRQKGFGYKRFTVNADIKDSVIHVERAYIDADNMAIIASGWMDPVNDSLDMTFLVAPLKTVDTIIQNIPLVNTILSGRLISFPAKATGKLSDPTVIPLHPSAVGKGLLNLFGDIIKAPVRLFQEKDTQ